MYCSYRCLTAGREHHRLECKLTEYFIEAGFSAICFLAYGAVITKPLRWFLERKCTIKVCSTFELCRWRKEFPRKKEMFGHSAKRNCFVGTFFARSREKPIKMFQLDTLTHTHTHTHTYIYIVYTYIYGQETIYNPCPLRLSSSRFQ